MKVVALTGGIGSGKSEATSQFAALGVPVVDTDIISHQLTASGQPLVSIIANKFGNQVVNKNGGLERAALRKLIFKDPAARAQLNAILHPPIHDIAMQQLAAHSDQPYAILAIPLLDEGSIYLSDIDDILLIDCDETLQIARVMQRSHLSEEEVRAIMAAQTPHKTRIKMANIVITNDESVAKLHEKIKQFHQKYIKTCIVSKTIS